MKRISVLLIEDNPEHASLIRTMLAVSDSAQYELDHFSSVESGIERLCRPGVDVVLLDLSLPDSEGIETFYRVYSSAPDVPIIVLSGSNDEALALETVQCGAQDYLVKGRVDRFWLARAIDYAIERKRTQEELRRARDELELRVEERTDELAESNRSLEREIAEKRRAEAALRESNKQLEQALERLRETQDHVIQRERLHALGRMASGIAHDFNNSLSPILGFSDLLLMRPEMLADQERATSYLKMIRMAAQDSANVVARLRDFYRPRSETEVFGSVRIGEIVREVISLTEPKWRNQALVDGVNIRIETDLQADALVSGNEGELREMLTNLVFNAVDAISRAGVIRFCTRIEDGRVILEVSDDGNGMPEGVRLRCLEPFYSTKHEHGTGLGLGIVYGIVTRHDGTIDIQSTEGVGTTVKISLPMRHEAEPAKKEASLSAPFGSVRVLVVEDEPLVREVIEAYLTGDGHHVELAENGLEGLEKFRGQDFDIVLTDRSMPEMNGDQLAVAIKERSPRTPIILLTGFGDLMEGEGETVPGVDVILSKPFSMESLRNAIAKGLKI